MPSALTHTYTDQDAIERLISEQGFNLRMDDLIGSNRSDYMTSLVADATELVNANCAQFYNTSDLANSWWVNIRATWVACYFLSQRRGNVPPASLAVRYKEILAELEEVRLGLIQIPGIPTSANMAPAMSNLIVDDSFNVRKLRVHQDISAGGTDGRQMPTWWHTHDFF